MEIMAVTEKFTSNQLKALGAIVLMLVLIIFGKVNIGLAALSCAAILLFSVLLMMRRVSRPCPGIQF